LSTRLEGWKEIAEYFGRTVRTIQRWEREQELPVRRHLHNSGSTVYAFVEDLASWLGRRAPELPSIIDDTRVDAPVELDLRALYAMSLHQWDQRTEDGFRRAIALARTALQRNPDYAPAHGVLALAHATRASYPYADPERDVQIARESAALALTLDPTLVEAHQALAFVRFGFEWQWRLAEASLEVALKLRPDDATSYQWLSVCHLAQGRDEEACSASLRAETLNPRSPIIAIHAAWMLHMTGRFDAAIEKSRAVIKRDPHFWRGYFNLALSLTATERHREAVLVLEVASALDRQSAVTSALAHALARAGEGALARQTLQHARTAMPYTSPYWLAFAFAAFDDDRSALVHLGEAVQRREWFVVFLTHDPAFTHLRQCPEFDALRRSIGLP
jgi:tetratricopeptide (TPR) repeat protein